MTHIIHTYHPGPKAEKHYTEYLILFILTGNDLYNNS